MDNKCENCKRFAVCMKKGEPCKNYKQDECKKKITPEEYARIVNGNVQYEIAVDAREIMDDDRRTIVSIKRRFPIVVYTRRGKNVVVSAYPRIVSNHESPLIGADSKLHESWYGDVLSITNGTQYSVFDFVEFG